jgi:hypothetical protein
MLWKILLVEGIVCDFENWFDCVCHGILLSKFKVFGIKCKNLVLYKFYLHNRYIITAIYTDSDKSGRVWSWGKIRHGGPQGSNFSSTNKWLTQDK